MPYPEEPGAGVAEVESVCTEQCYPSVCAFVQAMGVEQLLKRGCIGLVGGGVPAGVSPFQGSGCCGLAPDDL